MMPFSLIQNALSPGAGTFPDGVMSATTTVTVPDVDPLLTEVMPDLIPMFSGPLIGLATADGALVDDELSVAPDDMPEREKESDPQVLLDLLLAAPPITEPLIKQEIAATAMTPVPTLPTDLTAESDRSALPIAHLQKALNKAGSLVDSMLNANVGQQKLPTLSGEMISEDQSTTQNPTSPLVSMLLNRDITAGKVPILTLPVASPEQAEALKTALGERLEMQIAQRVQKASIRLDPPNLGRLDISIHYEAGKLHVQIQAAQADVYRALQQITQELRTSLSEQHPVQVNVQVSMQSGDSRQQRRYHDRPETPIAGNNEEIAGYEQRTDDTILTMV